MEQPKLSLPPATEADYRASVASCLAAMTEAGKERARIFLNDPKNQKKIKWHSTTQPNRPDEPAPPSAAPRKG